MLLLSRKVTEEICIGEGVVVTVVRIRGGRVTLGVTAPADTPVHRREILKGGDTRPRASGTRVKPPPKEGDLP